MNPNLDKLSDCCKVPVKVKLYGRDMMHGMVGEEVDYCSACKKFCNILAEKSNLDKLIAEKAFELERGLALFLAELRNGNTEIKENAFPKILNKIKSSLKDISYKSIEAVRVVGQKEGTCPQGACNGGFGCQHESTNQSIQKSAEKEKEFKGV